VLGIKPTATDKEIKDSYRKLCLKYHPDRNPGNKEEAEKKFKEISEAYRMISDPDQRRMYQDSGDSGSSPGGQTGFPGGFPGFGSGEFGFPGFQFPGGRGASPFGDLGDLFNHFHQQSGATTIREEIIMQNGRPWKKKITKTFKTPKGTRTEIIEEDI
jgi:DnaJ-class molecular chaperone